MDVPSSARDQDEGPRQRLVVLPVIAEKSGVPTGILETARRDFIQELNKEHRYLILTNQDFNQDVTRMKSEQGDYDFEAISKAGAGLGATALIEIKIIDVTSRRVGDSVGLVRQVKYKLTAQIRVRVFSARNGKELLNQTRSADVEDTTTHFGGAGDDRGAEANQQLASQAIRNAMMMSLAAVGQVFEKLSWEGRIALITGDRVFLNAGRLSGLQIGDILKVTEEGEEIYDPSSGKFIGKAPGRMKGTIEVVSYFGKDGAIAVIHSGSGFKENDRVEMY
jgi:mRNA-degrading endonuclease toxin of MazEF toxin-antitoxin module